jgi:hypothetical protein
MGKQFLKSCIAHRTGQWFSLGLLWVVIGALAGCDPSEPPPLVSGEELAKPISEQELRSYAKAYVAIEQLRKTTIQEMNTANSSPTNVTCTQPQTLEPLSGRPREIALNFCAKAKTISESSGLTILRFNAITLKAQTEPELQKQIAAKVATTPR